MSDNAVIYAAIGEKFIKECRTSILSLRKHHPTLKITVLVCGESELASKIITDKISNVIVKDIKEKVALMGLDPEYPIEASRGLKISAIEESSSGNNIFLDTDTFVKQPLDNFFKKIQESSSGLIVTNEPKAVHVQGGNRPSAERLELLSIEKYFNSGVYGFRKCDSVNAFSSEWQRVFLKQASSSAKSEWHRLCDQTAFNKALPAIGLTNIDVLSNTIWNAQCKILNELHLQRRLDDVHIIHCKLMHALGGDLDKVLKNNYVSKFSL